MQHVQEVTANGGNTLTIDPAGETLSGVIVNGTSIKLIPFWTLDTLFPAGDGVHASQNFGTLNSEILTPQMTHDEAVSRFTGGLAPSSDVVEPFQGSDRLRPDAAPMKPTALLLTPALLTAGLVAQATGRLVSVLVRMKPEKALEPISSARVSGETSMQRKPSVAIASLRGRAPNLP